MFLHVTNLKSHLGLSINLIFSLKYGQSFFIYLMKIDIVWYLIWSLDYLFKCQSWNWNCFIRSAICFQCIKRTYFWQVLAVAFCCILANKKKSFLRKRGLLTDAGFSRLESVAWNICRDHSYNTSANFWIFSDPSI